MKFTIHNAKRASNGNLYVTSSTVETSDGKIHSIPLSVFPTGSDEELLAFAQRYEDGLNYDENATENSPMLTAEEYNLPGELPTVTKMAYLQDPLIRQTCQGMANDESFTGKILTK